MPMLAKCGNDSPSLGPSCVEGHGGTILTQLRAGYITVGLAGFLDKAVSFTGAQSKRGRACLLLQEM